MKKTLNQSPRTIYISFTLLLIAMFVFVFASFHYLGMAKQSFERVINVHNVQSNAMNDFSNLTMRRSTTIQDMLLSTDKVEQKKIREQLRQISFDVLKIKKILLATDLSIEEKKLLDKQEEQRKHIAELVNIIFQLILNKEHKKAKTIFYQEVLPTQAIILENAKLFIRVQSKQNQQEMQNVADSLNHDNFFAVVFVSIGSLLILIISFWFVNRINKELKKRKIAESSLEKANQELEQRVKERTSQLESVHEQINAIIISTSEAIITIDQQQKIIRFNPSAEQMFKYRAEDIIGKSLTILLPEVHRSGHQHHINSFNNADAVRKQMGERATIYGMRSNGEEFPAEASICKTHSPTGVHFTAFLRDISDRVENEQKIHELAITDPLTGLFNRREFENKYQEAIEYSARFKDELALMILDLDDFKLANDLHGHQVGDELLRHVAKILKESVRSIDLVSRFGGDEFTLLLKGSNDSKVLSNIAENIIGKISQAIVIMGNEVKIGCSIGITRIKATHGEYEAAFLLADKAMYDAKKRGKNTFVFNDPE